MKRIMLIIIFLITVFGFVFYFAIYPSLKNEATIAVPDITGKSEEEAKEILDGSKIVYEIIYQSGDDNKVVKTIPEANSLIKESQKVIVYISIKEEERVADLTGLSYSDAIKRLEKYKEEYGINYNIIYKEIDSGIDNIVIFQSDTSSYLKDIKSLDITISEVNDKIYMPNLVGQNYHTAVTLCNDNGLDLGAIFISSILNKNTIIYQEPEPNTILYKNSMTKITIYVAK